MEIYNTILLIGAVQGFFLAGGLFVKNFRKKRQNPFFLGLILLISLALFANYNYSVERYLAFPHLWYLADGVAYLIGPLWYLTIRKSIQQRVKLDLWDLLLALPAVYYLGFLVYMFSLSQDDFLATGRNGGFLINFYLFCSTVLLTNAGFMLRAYRILRRFRDVRFPDLLIKGQYAFMVVIAIWMGSFLMSFLLSENFSINLRAYQFAFLSLAFLSFGMAFLALVRPASFYFLTQTFDLSETYVLNQIAERATAYIEEQEPYLQGNFTLAELSAAIGSNPVLTSKAINRVIGTTYSDLMNGYRVKHFLKLAREEGKANLTHWAIAQEAGFGNKVSFYKAFRKVMGTTPKVYLTAESKG